MLESFGNDDCSECDGIENAVIWYEDQRWYLLGEEVRSVETLVGALLGFTQAARCGFGLG